MLPSILFLCVLQGVPPVTPPAEAGRAPEWVSLNALRLIVNEEAITAQDLRRELLRRGRPATTRAELEQQIVEVGSDIVDRLLTIQAGKDMGFDESRIEQFVRDDMQTKIDRAGSVVEFGARLEAVDTNPQAVRESTRDDIYGWLWESQVSGRGAGPGGRVYVDRYVRPGRMLFEFRRSDPLKLVPATVTFRQLGLIARRVGGAEKALELARALRARLVAGESIDKLGEELEAAQQGGLSMSEPQELARVRANPILAAFLSAPTVGAVSEPLPSRPQGELEGYLLLQIHELNVPDPPAFDSSEIQQLLRKKIETRQQSSRSQREINKLLQAAYVWPPEYFGRAKAEPDASDD